MQKQITDIIEIHPRVFIIYIYEFQESITIILYHE